MIDKIMPDDTLNLVRCSICQIPIPIYVCMSDKYGELICPACSIVVKNENAE